jgi:hypothetical protein
MASIHARAWASARDAWNPRTYVILNEREPATLAPTVATEQFRDLEVWCAANPTSPDDYLSTDTNHEDILGEVSTKDDENTLLLLEPGTRHSSLSPCRQTGKSNIPAIVRLINSTRYEEI